MSLAICAALAEAQGPGSIFISGVVNSASFPVPVAPAAHWAGDVITLFVTGTGQATSAVTIHGGDLPVIPLSVEKGTFPGVMQIEVPIPFGQDCDVGVLIQVGDATSQPGVTIAIDICI